MENNQVMQEQLIGEGVGFERIRRITGYLVGTLDRCPMEKEHTA